MIYNWQPCNWNELKCFTNRSKTLQIRRTSCLFETNQYKKKRSIRTSIGTFNITNRGILNFSKKESRPWERDAAADPVNFPWKTVIAFYPNRVTATRFQRTSRRKSPRLLNETGAAGEGGNFSRPSKGAAFFVGSKNSANGRTRHGGEKSLRGQSGSSDPRADRQKRGNNQRGFFPISLPRCIDRSIHTRGQSASLKLHRLTNPRHPSPLDPPLFYFYHWRRHRWKPNKIPNFIPPRRNRQQHFSSNPVHHHYLFDPAQRGAGYSTFLSFFFLSEESNACR